MKGQTILVATDLSEGAGAAARFAAELGRRTGLPVVAVHIIEVGFPNWARGRYEVEVDAEARGAAEDEGARWYQGCTGEPPAASRVDVDFCVPGLRKAVKDLDCGLLVLSRTGKGALALAIAGSRVQQIAARPPCPVAIVEPSLEGAESTPLRVAAAVDFSKASIDALSFAATLTDLAKGELTAVSAVDVPQVHVGALEIYPGLNARDLPDGVEGRLTALGMETLRGRAIKVRAIGGRAAETLLTYARDEGVDVLVLGETGHSPVSEESGSLPRQIIRQLPCTLVVVPG